MVFNTRIVPIAAGAALFAGLAQAATSVTITYCASINTGSGSGNSSIYQSDGLCHDFCVDDYAFAIVQDQDCWCSNYVPAESTQVDVDDCDTSCPGYPSDLCGGDGLWGYMSLNVEPSGTTGASTSTATSTQDPATTTVQATVTVTPTSDPTSNPTSVSSTTSKSSGTSTSTATPTVSVATVTAGGTISLQTVTVQPTSTSDAGAGPDSSSAGVTSSQHGLSTGAAVGIAVGVLAAIVILGAIGVFFWLRRRRQRERELVESQGSHRGSSAGMMGTPTTAMASVWDGENMSTGRRSSRLMPHDPRMDPYSANIYTRFDNKSRESINTLQDNHDYSRKVLRTTNPDPPDRE
ncbi:hypothetical protein F5X96DRAFT_646560 [Biscogniauxia mediterranea]|nr:hypothetical protein F5X96DRAFT_646560 [Biscogniauxia mediterranea]